MFEEGHDGDNQHLFGDIILKRVSGASQIVRLSGAVCLDRLHSVQIAGRVKTLSGREGMASEGSHSWIHGLRSHRSK